jgi:23S rRNA (pseudouridine1915-N3)-methyltransferase
MKIRIIAVGKLKRGPLAELIDDYKKRCRWPIQILEIDHSEKTAEGAVLLSMLERDDHVVILDERGESLASEAFASQMDKLLVGGTQRINFIIGGAYGLDGAVISRAHKRLAFGVQTWPHMMVRLMLVEQIYRAEQILAGHPYHKP